MTADNAGRPASIAEGWQAEARHHQRGFHYVRGALSLCGRLGSYRGPLVPGGLVPSVSVQDCTDCRRRVDRELARPNEAQPSTSAQERL